MTNHQWRKNDEYSRFFDGKAHGAGRRRDGRRIFAGFEAKRKTTLRVNRLKTEPMQILKALADAGLSAQRVPWSGDALILDHADEGAVAACRCLKAAKSTCRVFRR